MGRDAECQERSPAADRLRGQDRDSAGTNSSSEHSPGRNPPAGPREAQSGVRVRAALQQDHTGFLPTPRTGSPACEVFGVCQAGQPWGASSHRAGELPGNLGAGYRRDAENPAWGRRRGT